MKSLIFYVVFFVFAGTALYNTIKKQDEIINTVKLETTSTPLNPALLKAISCGFNNIIADFSWFELIQKADEKRWSDVGKSWLFYKVNTIINLDPEFKSAYEYGGIYLTIFKEDYEGSKIIIDKAIEKFPIEWKFPFLIGYSFIFEKPNLLEANRYFKIATESPSAPPFVKNLASRLAARAGNFDFAISTLISLKNGATSEKEKDSYEEKIKKVIIEKQYVEFEEVLELYKNINKKIPSYIDELISLGVKEGKTLKEIDPLGGKFFIDNNGKIANTKNQRIKVYGYDKN